MKLKRIVFTSLILSSFLLAGCWPTKQPTSQTSTERTQNLPPQESDDTLIMVPGTDQPIPEEQALFKDLSSPTPAASSSTLLQTEVDTNVQP